MAIAVGSTVQLGASHALTGEPRASAGEYYVRDIRYGVALLRNTVTGGYIEVSTGALIRNFKEKKQNG